MPGPQPKSPEEKRMHISVRIHPSSRAMLEEIQASFEVSTLTSVIETLIRQAHRSLTQSKSLEKKNA